VTVRTRIMNGTYTDIDEEG